jgi:hypothetical protein
MEKVESAQMFHFISSESSQRRSSTIIFQVFIPVNIHLSIHPSIHGHASPQKKRNYNIRSHIEITEDKCFPQRLANATLICKSDAILRSITPDPRLAIYKARAARPRAKTEPRPAATWEAAPVKTGALVVVADGTVVAFLVATLVDEDESQTVTYTVEGPPTGARVV